MDIISRDVGMVEEMYLEREIAILTAEYNQDLNTNKALCGAGGKWCNKHQKRVFVIC